MSKVEVIAEIGSCHDGNLWKAHRLIDAAIAAGADAVKGQFWSSADALADRRCVPDVYREIYRRYRIPVAWLSLFSGQCAKAGVEWMCTAYLPRDVSTVAEYCQRFKVASFEANAADLLCAHRTWRRAGREVVVSLGMGGDVFKAMEGLGGWHLPGRVQFLHCVSAYPAPLEAMQLSVLPSGGGHNLLVGLSDHSRQVDMGALAVAAGAEIVEAHIRLDDTDPDNPDYATAFSPHEFAEYVALIRRAETIMGDGVRRQQPAEQAMAAYRVRS